MHVFVQSATYVCKNVQEITKVKYMKIDYEKLTTIILICLKILKDSILLDM